MNKWNPIVLGGRAWAALRDLSRRWCLGVRSGPTRRVAANGFSPEAYRARPIPAERPADAARMEGVLQLDGDRIRNGTPTKRNLKIPLPIPCQGRKIPLSDDMQIESVEYRNYLTRIDLLARCAISFETHRDAFAGFSLPAGNLERGARRSSFAWRSAQRRILKSRRGGPTSISNNRSWCIGRSPRCGSARLVRISGIAPGRLDAAADR
jgi:hypothetical protein